MLSEAGNVHPLGDLLRSDRLPHIWCPGCGIGIALGCFLRAVKELNVNPNEIAFISGIGCSGRAAGYVHFDSFHTTHGRAIPLAMGVKVARPNMHVVVFSGDGDLFAIGGNHFIHAARRNVDLLVICINNFNYGMTGGQLGPTTPFKSITTTTPYGNIEHPFNLVYLAAAAGATYVARWTVAHPVQLSKSIEKGLLKRGFAFIEVIAPCITLYARYNKLGGPLKVINYLKKNSVIRNFIDPAKVEIEVGGKIVVGEFVDVERPEFISELYRLIRERSGRDIRCLV
ncbi:MAG: 2-oxoacid:ferredoxin oxidoreductase subunit beta [Candidatus Methanomethylicota archaeon]|nr:thiamine pyrophosphate-dependent enzyme [Candidatus Culexmicrobium cathedralense]RLE48984.1 MAG: 2-oxoacid:ferredoxin oxidoreductase subunit beta [Candidatus Verstraetearchaeota archaeon]